MDLERDIALIESILFLENEPLAPETLQRITGWNRERVVTAIESIQAEYRKDIHGMELLQLAGGYAFSPKQPLWPELRPRYGKRNENRLSRAALETLSIIAYSQPITRQEIESIRGVSADGMIKLLLSRNIIREVGRKDAPGKPVQYGTTKDFLKLFRLASIADLPRMEELDQERFERDE